MATLTPKSECWLDPEQEHRKWLIIKNNLDKQDQFFYFSYCFIQFLDAMPKAQFMTITLSLAGTRPLLCSECQPVRYHCLLAIVSSEDLGSVQGPKYQPEPSWGFHFAPQGCGYFPIFRLGRWVSGGAVMKVDWSCLACRAKDELLQALLQTTNRFVCNLKYVLQIKPLAKTNLMCS